MIVLLCVFLLFLVFFFINFVLFVVCICCLFYKDNVYIVGKFYFLMVKIMGIKIVIIKDDKVNEIEFYVYIVNY